MAPELIGTLTGAPRGALELFSITSEAFRLSFPAKTHILAVEVESKYM